jgi:hypothetical protein
MESSNLRPDYRRQPGCEFRVILTKLFVVHIAEIQAASASLPARADRALNANVVAGRIFALVRPFGHLPGSLYGLVG